MYERKRVRGKRLMPSNLNQSGMFDQLCFMQIYYKICKCLGSGRSKIVHK